MTSEASRAAVLSVAGSRATIRMDGERMGVVLDATGLAPAERERLEAEVRAAAPAARVIVTAERVNRALIAVASGKGGVGKSTVSANLAIALARAGRRVGLIDADIYGPSQPRLMAAEGVRPEAIEKQLIPVPTRYGVPLLSMGQLVEPGRAIAWRGPMAAGALGQLVEGAWGTADTLVMDLPPGTGDVQLTMVQKYRPAGAVIVSTPQDLALIDATRAIDFFNKAGVPIIGLIENMAGYACPSCGVISDPFGRGGAEATAAELGLPFLGRVPLAIDIREASDAGQPPAARDDDRIFAPLAAQVADWLARR
ncbi:ATP-binding protein involved in chromosome partitioning [Sphingomonas sp. SORGH_AS802]|uniref:Mrp/NBP35 family ATP-binding protein n=1 Tax=unclassified Sphingomonas TaxID=196159 RepID=UPI00285793C7|nr:MULTISPECIES: Mrp/NBP35 family ATP-binding protein [unclassified Sphingomonas]MDR6127242.1 ATP-binding protein involved in chromosome partitioning [Sphingomonas sp. SORGH_AS_0438]MDR6133840.1 ATP-binding protein involved in chromosome partitioning [Sphingomonas sp. SORGH_AS_0802]